MREWSEALRIACFATGSAGLDELRRARLDELRHFSPKTNPGGHAFVNTGGLAPQWRITGMKRIAILCAALVALAVPALADGDAALGAKVFNKCKTCHENEKGVNRVGPQYE